MRRVILLTLLILGVALVGSSAYVLTAPHALRWLVALAVDRSAGTLTVESTSGRLIGPWRLQGIEYRAGNSRYRIDTLACDWRPTALWRGSLEIPLCRVQDLQVLTTPGESSGDPVQLPELTLPLRIQARVEAAPITVTRAAEDPIRVDRVALSVAAQGDKVSVAELQVTAQDYSAGVRGSIGLSAPHAVDVHADWSLRAGLDTAVDGTTKVRGDVARLVAENRVSGMALDLTQRIEVHHVIADPTWSTTIELNRVATHRLRNAWPPLSLSGRLRAAGGRQGITLSAAVAGQYADSPTLEVDLAAAFADGALTLEHARLHERGREGSRLAVAGTGRVDASRLVELDLAGDWEGLRWPLGGTAEWVSAQGRFTVHGNLEALRIQISDGAIHAPEKQVTGHDLNLELTVADVVDRPRIKGRVQARQAGVGDVTAADVAVDLDVDTADRETSEAALNVRSLRVGERTFTDLSVALTGRLAAHRVRIAAALDTGVDASVGLEGAYADRLWTGQLTETRIDGLPGGSWRLQQPAAVQAGAGQLSVAPVCVAEGARRVCVGGAWEGATGAWRATAQADALPLGDFVRLAQPDLTVTGSVSGTARFESGPSTPLTTRGQFQLTPGTIAHAAVTGEDRLVHGGATLDFEADPSRGRGAFSLDLPAAARVEGTVSLSNLTSVDLTAQQLDGTLRFKLPDASGYQRWWPALTELKGALHGELRLGGSRAAPTVTARAALNGAELRGADVGWAGDIAAQGSLQRDVEGGWTGQIEVTAPRGRIETPRAENVADLEYRDVVVNAELAGGALDGRLYGEFADGGVVDGTVQVAGIGAAADQSRLDGKLSVRLANLRLLQAVLPQYGPDRGKLEVDLRLGGSRAAPTVTGTAGIADAEFTLPDLGVVLTELNLSVRGAGGDRLLIAGRAEAGDGWIGVDGELALPTGSAWRTDLMITGDNATVVDRPGLRVLASPDLKLILTPRDLDLSGTVRVLEAEIRPTGQQAAGVVVSRDVVLVEADTGEPPAPAFAVRAQVEVRLGDRVIFDGFGLSGRLTGAMVVNAQPGKLTTANGELEILDGNYALYGQNLPIQTGRLVFAGGAIDNPGLDVRAERRIRDVTAGARVRGTATAPELALYSTPELPDAEKLSYLILGRGTSDASAAEGAILLRAATSLLPKGSGRVQETLQSTFGLDELSLQSDAENGEGSSLVLGKYLAPKLYVSYAAGLAEAINVFRIRYELSKKWTIQTESSQRESGGDLLYTIER